MISRFCKQGGDAVCGDLFNAVMLFSCAGYVYCRVVAMYWSGQDPSARTAREHKFGQRNEDNFELRSYENAADLHRKWNPNGANIKRKWDRNGANKRKCTRRWSEEAKIRTTGLVRNQLNAG